MPEIFLEGTDSVGKTTIIQRLADMGIVCTDRQPRRYLQVHICSVAHWLEISAAILDLLQDVLILLNKILVPIADVKDHAEKPLISQEEVVNAVLDRRVFRDLLSIERSLSSIIV